MLKSAQTPVRPHGEWAEVLSPTAVLSRRPRGVVPHADFKASLGTSWSPPPALQPLGHHLTLDAPTGLLTAAAVPVEAYAGAELRFTPAADDPADERPEPMEPAAPRQRMLDRVLRRPAAAPTPAPVPAAATPVPEPAGGTPARLTDAAEDSPALHRSELRPTLSAASVPTETRRPETPSLPVAVDPTHRSGPAPVMETPPLAGPLRVDADPSGRADRETGPVQLPVDAGERKRSGPARVAEQPPVAGPLRFQEPAAPTAQRSLLGHRALGADLMAAAAEVVLPRPVASLAPVSLPAPVAGRATMAPPSGPDQLLAAPPRPDGGWARPIAGHAAAAPRSDATAEHQPYSRTPMAPAFDTVPPPRERAADMPAPAGPVEPEPGLPDWWPAASTTWTPGDAEPGAAGGDRIDGLPPTADLADSPRPDERPRDLDRRDVPPGEVAWPDSRPDVALPAAARTHVDLPDLAMPSRVEPFADSGNPVAARPAPTQAAPMLQRRIRPTRDPATGMPVTRRVAWPLDVPTAESADPESSAGRPDRDEGAADERDREQPWDDAVPEAAVPHAARPAPDVPALRRVVRAPASQPDTDRSQPPAFPHVGPNDLASALAGDLPSELHRYEPADESELSRPDAGPAPADDAGSSATAATATAATAQAARPAAAPTADEVAGQLRHTLLVERERFGVLADLW